VDLLDRLLEHDRWTTAQLLDLCRPLTDEQLDRPFDIGHRSLRATLDHLIFNIEVWAGLMNGRITARADVHRGETSVIAMIDRLNHAAAEFSAVSRAVRDRGGWDERWTDVLDTPPAQKTYGGAIGHVITHSMHHRAQALHMLRALGVPNVPEGDVLSWEAQHSAYPRHGARLTARRL
jgi:uncharacterized damage-inducible protein DinB